MSRPPAPLRVFILIAAVACLGLAMCAHSQPPQAPANTAAQPQQPAQVPAQTPAPADAAAPPQQAAKPRPEYFAPTKAPSRLYE